MVAVSLEVDIGIPLIKWQIVHVGAEQHTEIMSLKWNFGLVKQA